ncbi:DNA-binding protein [Acinetobacter larvae]|uniref:DNA-binding protein n=1 Tax=Acinetobacter larvae TaxID=1789224 RepID=UPI000BFF881F|nr:DNA-binding protein [Acinetobacter larvae]
MSTETIAHPQMKIRVIDPNDHEWLKQHANKHDRSINFIVNQAIKLYKQIQGAAV